jgi:hypothetical protein
LCLSPSSRSLSTFLLTSSLDLSTLRCGLLDQTDQTALDLVDRIVFDSTSSSRVRAEAFAFMMDHTEGFDEDPDADADGGNETKTAKRKKSTNLSQFSSQDNNEMKTLARRKKTAIQLETLAEFADHHLRISAGGNLDYLNLLADACILKRPGLNSFLHVILL